MPRLQLLQRLTARLSSAAEEPAAKSRGGELLWVLRGHIHTRAREYATRAIPGMANMCMREVHVMCMREAHRDRHVREIIEWGHSQ